MKRFWMLAAGVALIGCSEDGTGDLIADPPPPTVPTACQPGIVLPISVGENPGFTAFDTALANGRVPAPQEFEANHAFGERRLDLTGACCEEDLCLVASVAGVPELSVPGPQAALQISLVTGAAAHARPPAARTIVVLVDASASLLSRGRIEAVRSALVRIAALLDPEDQIGLVAFDAAPSLLVPVGLVSDVGDDFVAAVEALEAGGGTNLARGLNAAFTEAARVADAGREQRVLLVTDGNDPLAEVDTQLIAEQLVPFHDQGIQLSVFGVGDPEAQDWLQPLTGRSDGRFWEDEDGESLEGLVTAELSQRYVPIATGLELRVMPPAGVRFSGFGGWSPPIRSDGVARADLSAVLLGPNGELVTPGQGAQGGPAMVFDVEGGLGGDEIALVLNYKPAGDSARTTFRLRVALPEGWPQTPSDGFLASPAASEALYARYLGEGLANALEGWANRRRNEALADVRRLEALVNDFTLVDMTGAEDPDVEQDRARVNRLRRRMEGLAVDPPDTPLPDDPWPGS